MATSRHPSTLAVHYATTFCNGPTDDATTWAAQEGTTVDRLRHYVGDPDSIVAMAVEDPSLVDAATQSNPPIKGLRNFSGLAVEFPLMGSGSVTADTAQVTETAQMRLLEHALGGLVRGYSSAITTVNSQVSYELTTATGLVVGGFYCHQDNDDLTKLYPFRVIATSGSPNIQADRAPPFTINNADHCKAMATAYIDDDALSNPSDAAATTINILIQKGSFVWEALGCRLQLDQIAFPRNAVPKLVGTIDGTYVRPPGDGAPSAPTWAGSVQGAAGRVVGAQTQLHVQDVGTTTRNMVDVVAGSAVMTVGLPRPRVETGTETSSRREGTYGYSLGKGDSIFEMTAILATGWQDAWDTAAPKIVSYYQVEDDGYVWCLHMPYCYLLEPPKPVGSQELNCYTLKFKAVQDRTVSSTNTDLGRSRFTLSWG